MWRRILICRFIYRFSMDCTFPSLSKFAPLVIIYSKRPASENLHLFPFFSILSSNNMNDRVFCRVLEPPQIIDSNQMIVGPSKRPFKIWRDTRKAWENISLSSPLLRSVRAPFHSVYKYIVCWKKYIIIYKISTLYSKQVISLIIPWVIYLMVTSLRWYAISTTTETKWQWS